LGPLAGIPVADPETPEAAKFNLLALAESIGNVIEEGVHNDLSFFLGEVGELDNFVNQVRFRHTLAPSAGP